MSVNVRRWSVFGSLLIILALSPWLVPAVFNAARNAVAKYEWGLLLCFGLGALTAYALERKKWFQLAIIGSCGLFLSVYYKFMASLLYQLGTDSFSELQDFNWHEALFYITTLQRSSPKISTGLVIYAASVGVLFAVMHKNKKAQPRDARITSVVGLVGLSAVLGSIYAIGIKALSTFRSNDQIFERVTRNFDHPSPAVHFSNNDLKVVVYIGESTSITNMGLYGYPRQTTPRLSRLLKDDPNLLLFSQVFATHTHTSQSLLEAFSLGLSKDEGYLPIYERKRISIANILSSNSVDTYLFSNHGESGTWNLASSVVFRHAKTTFSARSKILGNLDQDVPKPFDHEFLLTHLERVLSKLAPNKNGAVILHSYAGHGPYLRSIPPDFRNAVDDYVASLHPEALVGGQPKLAREVEDYDSAIGYIDFCVAESIELIKRSEHPVVFLYFSDHGDAIFAGSGHDSARFIHEMIRVPFFLYFNDRAKTLYPELFAKYRNWSRDDRASTLAQLSSTILDLLGAQPERLWPDVLEPIGGSLTKHLPPVVVRETVAGTVHVDIAGHSERNGRESLHKSSVNNDSATEIYVATRSLQKRNTEVCYHRSNTIAKALRGTLVSTCLEVDLTIEPSGLLSVHHPPAKSVGLSLDRIAAIAERKRLALWLDAKNIHESENCGKVVKFLKRFSIRNVLVEFPTQTAFGKDDLLNCSNQIKSMGFRTSYYVSTENIKKCSAELGSRGASNPTCDLLENELRNAFASRLFTDFSFDYAGITAMEKSQIAHLLEWNTWNVAPQKLGNIAAERFNMVILTNQDPNNR